MESCIHSIKRLLAVIFHEHSPYRYHYYGVTLEGTNTNSLASFLQLEPSDYSYLLCAIDVARLTRRNKNTDEKKMEIKYDSFKNYLTASGLGDDIYFDNFQCTVPVKTVLKNKNAEVSYRGLWIGFGDKSGHEERYMNLSALFSFVNNPPRLSSKKRVLTRQLRTAIQILREEEQYADEADNNEDNWLPQQKIEHLNMMMEREKTISTTASVQNITTYLDDFKSNKVSKQDITELLEKALLESIEQIENKRVELIKDVFRNPVQQQNDDEENTTDKEEELIKGNEEKMKVVPGLARLGVPLQRNILRVIVRELSILSNLFPKEGILNYTSFKGVEHSMLHVPVCKNKKTFIRMDQKRKFIESLPSLICNSNNNNDENQTEKATEWILYRMAKQNEEVFIRVANDLGYNLGIQKEMDSSTAHAMWDGSNTNIKSQRVIVKYLKGTFGRKIKIPITNNQDNEARDNVGMYGPIDPVSNRVTIKGEEFFYWTKPLIHSLSSSCSCRIYSNVDSNDATDRGLHSVDLVVGGDHGQRMFRMLIKVILRKEDKKKIDEFVLKVGHIDCKKDTYEVIKNTISPTLNDDMKALLSGEKKLLIFRKEVEGEEGKYIYTSQINSHTTHTTPKFVCPLTNTELESFEFTKACNIRLVITGDLAFYAACLGKVNGSGHWCSWCQLSFKEWETKGHDFGDVWTLQKMGELREKLYNKEIRNIASNRKGCTDTELFDCIEIWLYIYPILHSEIGLGNYVLNSFFNWIDFRIEDVTQEEKDVRKDFGMVMVEIEGIENEWKRFCNEKGDEVAALTMERADLREMKKFRDEDGKYSHSVAERKELDVMIKEIDEKLKPLNEEKKKIEDDNKMKKKILAKYNKKLLVYEKKGERKELLG